MKYLEAAQGVVLGYLENSKFDFSTAETIYEDLNEHGWTIELVDVRWCLYALELKGLARQPIVRGKKYELWWRATERGTTRREKWTRFLSVVGHDYGRIRPGGWDVK